MLLGLIFSFSAVPGVAEHGTQYQLRSLYEHKLQRAAFNFCCGPFGGVKGLTEDYLKKLFTYCQLTLNGCLLSCIIVFCLGYTNYGINLLMSTSF